MVLAIERGNTEYFGFPHVVASFVRGKGTLSLLDNIAKPMRKNVLYDDASDAIWGSSTVLAARIDTLLQYLGIRVTTPADLGRPEIMEMAGDMHYCDAPAIVFRSMEDPYEPNNAIIRQLAPLVERKNGKVRLPVLVTGFDFEPSDDKGYRLRIIARRDFTAVEDGRLSGKYEGRRFSKVDERGLPIFDSSGRRTWHAKDDGISGFYLDKDHSLATGYHVDSLTESSEHGRIILVRDMKMV